MKTQTKIKTAGAVISLMALVGFSPASAQPAQNCSTSFLGVLSCETTYPEDPSGSFKQLDGIKLTGIAVTPGKPVESASNPGTYADPGDNMDAEVWGNDGVAVGNGARVGVYVPDACSAGVPGKGSKKGKCVDEQGAVIADAVFTPDHTIPTQKGTALGSGAVVTHDNSTVVGAGAKSTADHQVTLGTEDETIKAPGITSAKSKARQSGPLQVVTTDASGNLASDGGVIYQTLDDHGATLNEHSLALASQQSQITRLDGKMKDSFEGIAIALAMESPQVDPGKRFGVSLNWGNFEGENALAGAAKLRFDDTWAGTAGVGYGMGRNTLGVRAGIQAQW